MPILIADTWIASVTKLPAADATRAWEFFAKYKDNPAHPSLSLERINDTREQNFWSGRISQKLRAVLHQDGPERVLVYAGRHDDAYEWARTHRLEHNAMTGTLQLVVSPEVVEPILAPATSHAPPLFANHEDAYLLSLGLPPDWLPTLRKIVSEDQLLEVAGKLPEDVQDRLLALADGQLVTPPAPLAANRPVLESPDARRSFYSVNDDNDLQKLLAAPLATWMIFLHPSQERLAYGTFKGPLKITGSAGTGKTVVAMHRARHLALQGKRVLFTTFIKTLCTNLENSLALLCPGPERQQITVATVHSRALALVQMVDKHAHPAIDEEVRTLMESARQSQGCGHSLELLLGEWEGVTQAQGITTWEGYRTASRAGRGTPLSMKERKTVWQAMAYVQDALARKSSMTYPDLCRHARELLLAGQVPNPYDAVIVDESQDLGPQELLLLAALGGAGQDGLTLVGDGGQRIYGKRTSLKSLGIDVRGRSYVLRLNYRTTEQIRRFAERLIRQEADDLEGGHDDRRGVRNLLGGPQPLLRGFPTADAEHAFVVDEITGHIEAGRQPEDIAIFARKRDLLEPLKGRLHAAGLRYRLLTDRATASGVNLGTMHGAKGLEFKVVFVIDVSDDQMPQPKAYKGLTDPQARDEALRGEMQLLYVSVTRARDEAYLTWVGEKSRFLP